MNLGLLILIVLSVIIGLFCLIAINIAGYNVMKYGSYTNNAMFDILAVFWTLIIQTIIIGVGICYLFDWLFTIKLW